METQTECKSVEDVTELLIQNEKGQVASTPENYNLIFQNDPKLKGVFSMNLLTNRIDVVKELWWYRESERLEDLDIQYLILYFDHNYHISSEKWINGALKVAANENRHHPIQEYLNALHWDEQERVRYALHRFLGADVSDYNYEVLRLFMLGAVTRVFKPGVKFEDMLCLVGSQGVGKSSFFRLLAIKDEWFSDDLRRLDDENVFRKIQGHWIIEMSEMIATVNAKSIEDIKAFLSRQRDTYKVPYETHPKDYERQCVFAGTSNTLDFLPLDRTGNRRFLPVQCHADKAEIHILEDEAASRIYIDQMWAEIMEVFRKGDYSLKLSGETEKYLSDCQKEFMPEDTFASRILNYLDDYSGDMVCSLQLYYEALGHASGEEPRQYEIRDINSVMNNYATGWERFENPRHFRAPYKRQKGWMRKAAGEAGDDFHKITDEEARQLSLPEEWLDPKDK